VAVTAVVLVLPFLALGLVGRLLWGRLIHPVDILLAVVLCTITGSLMIGERPSRTRHHDRATSLWPPAPLSFGESPHHLHHADPTSARHGVDRGRLGPSAAVIRLLERLGRLHDARRRRRTGSRPVVPDVKHPIMQGS
jgi:stearoyl-CoA desaturase (Delta-9 desaturase)